MDEKYKGTIIKESLEDSTILKNLDVTNIKLDDEDPNDVWHIYTVNISKGDIEKLSKIIKQKWYMHFWKDRKVIVIFKDKEFEFDYDKKETWKPAVNYGLLLGIPKEQLDFPIS